MTVADLLARASGRELQAWQVFLKVREQRRAEAQREQAFTKGETAETESLLGLLG